MDHHRQQRALARHREARALHLHLQPAAMADHPPQGGQTTAEANVQLGSGYSLDALQARVDLQGPIHQHRRIA